MTNPIRYIISTRPKEQNSELKKLLAKQGYTMIELPMIEIKRVKLQQMDIDKLKNIQQYNWIIFTSPNGVRHFFHHYKLINGNTKLPQNVKIAVVGTTTQKILEEYGTKATIVNPGNTGSELADYMLNKISENNKILFPEGNIARGIIAKKLTPKAKCDKIVVYKNQMPATIDESGINRIIKDQYEFIILTSPSGFINLTKTLTNKTDLTKLRFVSIGTTTSAEIEKHGLKPYVTANMSNAQGIATIINKMQNISEYNK